MNNFSHFQVNNLSTNYQFSTTVSWTLGILTGIVSLSTVTGNLFVLFSFVFERSLRASTNYFIASLAVTDLFIGIFSMNFYTIYLLLSYWPFGELLCDLWLSLDYTACLTSQYTVFFITVDRFCSVKIPTKYRNWRTDNKVRFMVAITWIVPIIVFFTTIMGWPYLNSQGRTRKEDQCYAEFASEPIFNTILTIAYFWITLFVMIFLYGGIYKVALDLQAKSDNRRKHLKNLMPWSLGIQTNTSESELKSVNLSQSVSNSMKSSYHFGIIQIMDNNMSSNTGGSIRYYHLEKSMSNSLKTQNEFHVSNESSLNNVCNSNISKSSYIVMNSDGQDMLKTVYSSHLNSVESPYIPDDNETPNNMNSPLRPQSISINNGNFSEFKSFENNEIDLTYKDENCQNKNTNIKNGLNFINVEEVTSLLGNRLKIKNNTIFNVSSENCSPVWIRRKAEPTFSNNLSDNLELSNPTRKDVIVTNNFSKKSLSLIAPIKFISQHIYKKSNMKNKTLKSACRVRRALRTITFILGAFMLSWTPFHIIVLIKGFCDSDACINDHLYNLTYWLCYLNSPINPFCYAMANAHFKRTFLRILRCDLRRF